MSNVAVIQVLTLACAVALWSCGGDDEVAGEQPVVFDGSPGPDGPAKPDAAAADAAVADAAAADTCLSRAGVATLDGVRLETFSEGGELSMPLGLDIGIDGSLYVAERASQSGGSNDQIVRILPDGSQSVYASHALLDGLYHLSVAPASFGTAGDLYVHARVGGQLIRVPADGGDPEVFLWTGVAGTLAFGSGGDFGYDLYHAARSVGDLKLRAQQITPAATATVVPLEFEGSELTGVWSLDFAHGGALGDALYVGTMSDEPTIDDSARPAIYRVDPGAAPTLLAWGLRNVSIEANPEPSNGLGDYLYGVDGENQVFRVTGGGTVEVVAAGLQGARDLAFGGDGALYISEMNAARISRIVVCD